jgi:hypothetical protein
MQGAVAPRCGGRHALPRSLGDTEDVGTLLPEPTELDEPSYMHAAASGAGRPSLARPNAGQFEEFLAAELASLQRRVLAQFRQEHPRSGAPTEVHVVDADYAGRVCERWGTLVSGVLHAEESTDTDMQPSLADIGARLLTPRERAKNSDDDCEPHPEWLLPSVERRLSMGSEDELSAWMKQDSMVWNETVQRTILERLILHPDSLQRLLWASIGAVLLLWDMIFIPLEASGLLGSPWQTLIVCAICYWGADIFVQMFTGYKHDLHTEMSPSKVFVHYARTWLAFDISMVLIDVAFVLLDLNASTRTFRLVRLCRLVRMVQLRKWKEVVDARMARNQSELMELLFKVGWLTITIFLLCHYVACAWYGLGEESRDSHEGSWVEQFQAQGEAKTLHYYSHAIHWSMTQFSPATNNIAPANTTERVFASGVVMMGMITFSSFLSSMAAAINELRSLNVERRHQRLKLLRFMTGKDITTSLSRTIISHFDQWEDKTQVALVEQDVPLLVELPESVRVHLHVELYFNRLMTNTILSTSSKSSGRCFVEICHEAMSGERYMPQEEVFMDGKPANFSYIIAAGNLEYATYTNRRSRARMLSRDRYTRLASVYTPETIHESSLSMKQIHSPDIDDWGRRSFLG